LHGQHRQGTVCKILARNDVKPHKVRYYLERRDAAFETKMAEVLCVYREVAVLRESQSKTSNVAIISYDEKPGIQAIANTAPDLPPKPGEHESFARDHAIAPEVLGEAALAKRGATPASKYSEVVSKNATDSSPNSGCRWR